MSGMRREAVKVVRPDLFVSVVSLIVLAIGGGGKRLRSCLRPGGYQFADTGSAPICLERICKY